MMAIVLAAAIFDMDGLIVDSEPLWHEVEIEVFGSLGVRLDDETCLETTGLRTDDVVKARLGARTDVDFAAVEERILSGMATLITERAEAKPGVHHAIEIFVRRGWPLALASSSPPRLINAVLERLKLIGKFAVVHSAHDETHGKPHPAVYITTANQLRVAPERCVALEDSLRGVIAAKAASMRCIAVPERNSPKFAVADLVLSSLEELKTEHLETL